MRAIVLALSLIAAPALADQPEHPGPEPFRMTPGPAQMSQRCMPADTVKAIIMDKQGKWTALAPEQYYFMQGIFVLNPNTAQGLPLGSSAILAQLPGDKGGVVMFIDKDRACDAMPVPEEIVTMLGDVAAHVVHHDGDAL